MRGHYLLGSPRRQINQGIQLLPEVLPASQLAMLDTDAQVSYGVFIARYSPCQPKALASQAYDAFKVFPRADDLGRIH